MPTSFYDILGVSRDADGDEIRDAYRQRLKETHPDLNDDPDATDRTQDLVEARDVLTDPAERARYDRLGHARYVAEDEPATNASDAASAWRSRSDDESSSGPTNARAGPEERRRRERAAREQVDGEDVRGAGHSTDPAQTASDSSSTTGDASTAGSGTTGTASTNRAAGFANAAGTATPGGGGTRRTTRDGGATPSWSSAEDGWAARTPTEPAPTIQERTLESVVDAPATALVAFVLYPLLVFGTFFPPFPLFVQGIVGVCLLAMIAATQSMPGIGVAIFGGWTVLGSLGLVVAAVHPFSPVGLVALGATWLPLGFSVLTLLVIDQ